MLVAVECDIAQLWCKNSLDSLDIVSISRLQTTCFVVKLSIQPCRSLRRLWRLV